MDRPTLEAATGWLQRLSASPHSIPGALYELRTVKQGSRSARLNKGPVLLRGAGIEELDELAELALSLTVDLQYGAGTGPMTASDYLATTVQLPRLGERKDRRSGVGSDLGKTKQRLTKPLLPPPDLGLPLSVSDTVGVRGAIGLEDVLSMKRLLHVSWS